MFNFYNTANYYYVMWLNGPGGDLVALTIG